MKTNLNKLVDQIKNNVVFRDMLGFELHIGDIITYHCKRADKQVIGYIYFIDKAKVYVCNTKYTKQSFNDEITHTEKKCVKINDVYSFNNLGIPEKGEKLYKRTVKYFVFIKPKNEYEKWKFSVIKPQYSINELIIEKMYEVFGQSTIDNLNQFFLLIPFSHYMYPACSDNIDKKLAKTIFDHALQYNMSILAPYTIDHNYKFKHITSSERQTLYFNKVQTIEYIDENSIVTDLHTYKNNIASINIWDIYTSIKYYS